LYKKREWRGRQAQCLEHPKPNHPSIKQITKDSPRIRGTTLQIQQAARHLRQNLTPAEAKLWSVLQKRQKNGLKFRCQHPLGRFIVDFYCPTYKLIIEIDGQFTNNSSTTIKPVQNSLKPLAIESCASPISKF